MPKCHGKCSKQQYDTRNVRVTTTDKSDDDCPNLPRNLRDGAMRTVVTALEEDVVLEECEGDDCACSYQDPPSWGDWVDGTGSTEVTVAECVYTINYTYEIRARIVEGACVPTSFKAANMGIIEGGEILVMATKAKIKPGALEKAKDALT